MPRVVPSQVVEFISQIPITPVHGGAVSMNQIGVASLSSVRDLSSQTGWTAHDG